MNYLVENLGRHLVGIRQAGIEHDLVTADQVDLRSMNSTGTT
jgi:hypothetical protein